MPVAWIDFFIFFFLKRNKQQGQPENLHDLFLLMSQGAVRATCSQGLQRLGLPWAADTLQGEPEQVVHSRFCRACRGSTAGSWTSFWRRLIGVGRSYACMYACCLAWSLAARSQKNSGWKWPLEVSSPVSFSMQAQEEQVIQGLFQSGFDGLQGCKSCSLSGPLSQCFTTFTVKKCFRVSSQDFPCPRLHPQPLSLSGHLWGESGASFPKSSHEVSVGSGMTPRAFPWPYTQGNLGDCRYLKVKYSRFFHVLSLQIRAWEKYRGELKTVHFGELSVMIQLLWYLFLAAAHFW